jgi:ABC-type Co2+ transport system permease subunit
LIPVAYVLGCGLLLSASGWAIMQGAMDAVPAILMPWAGFYWSKLFFWRGIVN